jgi:hypothetical protein
MSLSIKGDNPKQQSLILLFMLSLPLVILYKITAIVIIYANIAKFKAIEDVKKFFENDVLYDTFTNFAEYTGVSFSVEFDALSFFTTLVPEIFIGF